MADSQKALSDQTLGGVALVAKCSRTLVSRAETVCSGRACDAKDYLPKVSLYP